MSYANVTPFSPLFDAGLAREELAGLYTAPVLSHAQTRQARRLVRSISRAIGMPVAEVLRNAVDDASELLYRIA